MIAMKVMTQDVSAFVERYQLIYEKDPDSKVFAPLAEAYRRMGLLEEAIDLAERGVKKHPNFASGRVALGKCYSQKGEFIKAVEQLEVATSLSPENLLAHQLLAQCFKKLHKPMEALNAYKMVLFLNPNDTKTANLVADLEQQFFTETKEDFAEEDFAMEKLTDVAEQADSIGLDGETSSNVSPIEPLTENIDDTLERELALLDTRLQRGDMKAFRHHLEELLSYYPQNPKLLERKFHLEEITHSSYDVGELIEPIAKNTNKIKIDRLEKLLERIELLRRA